MAKARNKKRSQPAKRAPSGRGRPAATPLRRGLSPLTVAALAIAAGSVLLFALTRGSDNTSSSAGGFVGGDLHSVVALNDGRVYVGGHDGVTVTRDRGRTWTQVA